MAKSTQTSTLTSSSSSDEWVHVSNLGPFNIAEQPQENEIVRLTCETVNSRDGSLVKFDPPHGITFTESNYTNHVHIKVLLHRSLEIQNNGGLPTIDCISTLSSDNTFTYPSLHPPGRVAQNTNKERMTNSTDYTTSMKSQVRSTNVITNNGSLCALLFVMLIGYYIVFGEFLLKRPRSMEKLEWMDEDTHRMGTKKKSKTNSKTSRRHGKKKKPQRTDINNKNKKLSLSSSPLCASATVSQFSSCSEAKKKPKEESSLVNCTTHLQHGSGISSSGGHDNKKNNDIALSEWSKRLVDERQEIRVICETPVLSVSGAVAIDSHEVKGTVGSGNHSYQKQVITRENGVDEDDSVDKNNGGDGNLIETNASSILASNNDTVISKRLNNINNNNSTVDGHSISKDIDVISRVHCRNDNQGDNTVEDITLGSTTASHATHNPELFAPISKIHTTTQDQKGVYESITLLVDGMSCDGCAQTVRSVLENITGVDTVVVDQRKGKVVLKSSFSPSRTTARLDLTAIVEALNVIGMQAYLPVPLLSPSSPLDTIVMESNASVNDHHRPDFNKESSITSSSLSSSACQILEDDVLSVSLKKEETTLSLMDELRIGTRPVRRYRCACNSEQCICSSRPVHADDDGRDISLRDICARIEDSLRIDTTTSGGNASPCKGIIGSPSTLSLLKYHDRSLEELFLDNGGSDELRDRLALLPMPCECSSARKTDQQLRQGVNMY